MTTLNEQLKKEHDGAPKRNKSYNYLRALVLIVVFGAASFFGWQWWQQRASFETTDNATLDADLIPVTSEVAGRVLAVHVDSNESVEAGQLLIELDPKSFQIAVREARANLRVAEERADTSKAGVKATASQAKAQSTQASGGLSQSSAGIETAEARVTEARAAAGSAEARLAQAKSSTELAETEYARFAALAERGYVTTQEMDVARSRLETARAGEAAAEEEANQARARIEQAESAVSQSRAQRTTSIGQVESAESTKMQIAVRQEEYETAVAQVEVARAALARAELQLSQTKITAKAPGVIGRKLVAPGQQITPGQNLLAIVLPKLWVEANFKETQMRKLFVGQEVEIEVDALPGVELEGTIESLSPASGATFSLLPPENATGNFTKVVQRISVRITLDEAQVQEHRSFLSPGMSVIVKAKVR